MEEVSVGLGEEGREGRECVPRSLMRISLPAITSLCWLMSAFLSFRIFFFSGSKIPNRFGSLPACLPSLSLTSCTVVLSVISTLVGSFLIGFAVYMSAGGMWTTGAGCTYNDS